MCPHTHTHVHNCDLTAQAVNRWNTCDHVFKDTRQKCGVSNLFSCCFSPSRSGAACSLKDGGRQHRRRSIDRRDGRLDLACFWFPFTWLRLSSSVISSSLLCTRILNGPAWCFLSSFNALYHLGEVPGGTTHHLEPRQSCWELKPTLQNGSKGKKCCFNKMISQQAQIFLPDKSINFAFQCQLPQGLESLLGIIALFVEELVQLQ